MQRLKTFLKRHLPGLTAWYRRFRRTEVLRDRPRYTSPLSDGISILNCCVAYNIHGGYCLPLASRHRKAAQKILKGKVWEPDTLAYLATLSGDIIHAGTYFGDFLPALSRSRAADAKVFAFEPNPENFRCAAITVALNRLENVELVNAGLSDRRASVPMRMRDAQGRALGGMSHILPAGEDTTPGDMGRVEVVTVDEIFPASRHLAVLQLDVEGFEAPALRGAMQTIKRCSPVIVAEGASPDVAALLDPLGYRPTHKLHENTVFVRR
jgi:FkbM family methyltransferase